jgi:hypothetical protein
VDFDEFTLGHPIDEALHSSRPGTFLQIRSTNTAITIHASCHGASQHNNLYGWRHRESPTAALGSVQILITCMGFTEK